jgi:hypothetical protein
MKRCSKCKEWKEISEFGSNKSKKDGLATECKICANINSLRYSHSPHGSKMRKLYEQRDNVKKRKADYEHSERGKQNKRKNLNKFPEKRKARRMINNAIRDGRFPHSSTENCIACGNQAQEYHHYLGYDIEHWFDIQAVCKPCHIILDKAQVQLS